GADRIFNGYMGVDYSGAPTQNVNEARTIAGQKGSGRPTAAVANHSRAVPRPGYGAGQYQEGRGGPRRPVDGGDVAAGGPDGIGVFVRRPLDGSPGAKIKFKLGGTFQTFNPAFGHVR